MEHRDLEDLYQWKKRQLVKLIEIGDLTGQLAQAADRGDQVSVRMLLSMRAEPVRQASEIEQAVRSYVLSQPEERAIRLSELLRGAPAQAPEEEPLCEQVARDRRELEKCRALDQRVSLRLGGSKSFYNKFREE